MSKLLPKDRLRWATMIRRDRRFKPTEHSIATEIANRANEDGCTWVGKRRLAVDLGLSQRTIQRGLSKFKSFGYLKAKSRPGTSSYHYICFPDLTRDSDSRELRHHSPDAQATHVSQTYIKPMSEPNTVLDRKMLGRYASPAVCEAEVADRLGQDGYVILEKLKPWQVARLIGKLRDGTLDANDIFEARTTASRDQE